MKCVPAFLPPRNAQHKYVVRRWIDSQVAVVKADGAARRAKKAPHDTAVTMRGD